MIGKRSFMSLVKDYNSILGVYTGRLKKMESTAHAIAFAEESKLPENVNTFMLDNIDIYRELGAEAHDRVKERVSHHCDYGDINRLCSNSFDATLCNDDWLMSFAEDMNMFAAPYGNLSNTCIFRHAKVKDRRISVINRKFPVELRETIKDELISFADDMYKVYYNFYIDPGLPDSLANNVTGFVRGKSYVEHAREHLGCKSAISVDISKFYDSISLSTIITNDLYLKSLIASFKIRTGMDFAPETFTNPNHFQVLRNLFNIINLSFINIMNYYTHNGLLPTGANYSPVVSNIIFAPMDLSVKKYLSGNIKYTRYADDICISSMEGYNEDGSFVLNMDYVLELERIVNGSSFYLNYDKTHIMGPRDKKKIAGIILDTSGDTPKLSIGSNKKLEIKKMLEGKRLHNLDPRERGILEWVKSINRDQYQFIRNSMDNSCILTHKLPSPHAAKQKRRETFRHSRLRNTPSIVMFKPGGQIRRGLTYDFYPDYVNRTDRAQPNNNMAEAVDIFADFAEGLPF